MTGLIASRRLQCVCVLRPRGEHLIVREHRHFRRERQQILPPGTDWGRHPARRLRALVGAPARQARPARQDRIGGRKWFSSFILHPSSFRIHLGAARRELPGAAGRSAGYPFGYAQACTEHSRSDKHRPQRSGQKHPYFDSPSTELRTRLSTRLKILSRVTAPTAGQVKVKGRVASLLEACPEPVEGWAPASIPN